MNVTMFFSLAFVVGMLIVDWLQTLSIAREPDRFYEVNIVLGKHPSVARVSWYFAICIALLLIGFACAYLMDWERPAAAICLIFGLFELGVVVHNRRTGIRT